MASEKSLDLSELLFQALQDEAMDTGSRAWLLIRITAGPLKAHQGLGLVHLKIFDYLGLGWGLDMGRFLKLLRIWAEQPGWEPFMLMIFTRH